MRHEGEACLIFLTVMHALLVVITGSRCLQNLHKYKRSFVYTHYILSVVIQTWISGTHDINLFQS